MSARTSKRQEDARRTPIVTISALSVENEIDTHSNVHSKYSGGERDRDKEERQLCEPSHTFGFLNRLLALYDAQRGHQSCERRLAVCGY